MKLIKVGIVGLGKMGILHFGILNSFEDVKVIAVADTEKMITKFASNVMSDLKIYESFDQMINSVDLDLIYITTPVDSHLPLAKKCIEKNLHFFVEKPFSVSADGCKEVVENLKKADVKTFVGYYLRFMPTFSRVKKLIDEKILGEIIYVNSSIYLSQLFKKSGGWRFNKKQSGGGVLLDLGVHLIDLLLWYFGNVESVIGTTKSFYSGEVEDFVHGSLKFKNNLVVNMDVSWSILHHRLQETTIEVHGTNGMLLVNDDYIKLTLNEPAGGFDSGNTVIYKQSLPDEVSIDIGGPEYTKENRHFVNCIKNNEKPLVDVIQAIKIQNVVDSIYKTAKSGKVEEVTYLG